MRAVAVALLVEEQRSEILAGWRRDVERELGGEPVLAFAVGPLLREMALALRGDPSPLHGGALASEAGARSAVLVRSSAAPARIAREFKLLHRALWEALKAAGAIVGAAERRAGDEWLDEALATALDRQDRVRARADLLPALGVPPLGPPLAAHDAPAERGHSPAPAKPVPPPLPRRPAPDRPALAMAPVIPARTTPPPLPRTPPAPVPEAVPDAISLE